MNRVLRRPMFRTGGSAEGITSGLSRQPLNKGGGADVQLISSQPWFKSQIANLSNTGNTGNRSKNFGGSGSAEFFIDLGLDLLSRPKSGNIFQQIGASAKEPFEKWKANRAFQEQKQWMQDERDWKRKAHMEKMTMEKDKMTQAQLLAQQELDLKRGELSYEKIRDEADRKLQEKIAEMETKGKQQWLVEEIEKHWDAKIAAAPPGERERLEALKAEDKYKALQGYDVSDKMAILRNTRAFEEATDLARAELEAIINPATGKPWNRKDKGFSERIIEITNRYLRQLADFLDEDKTYATGGRVGYQGGGMSLPSAAPVSMQAAESTDQGTTNEINISYEQLRDRLPPEITDDIVLLLSQSYEAFADFAEIQTQADVNEFNTKYNVQLFLPKQAEA